MQERSKIELFTDITHRAQTTDDVELKIEDEGEDSDDNDDSKKSEVVQLDPVPEEKEEQIEDAEKVEEMVQKEEPKVEENANEEPTRCLILK